MIVQRETAASRYFEDADAHRFIVEYMVVVDASGVVIPLNIVAPGRVLLSQAELLDRDFSCNCRIVKKSCW